MRARSRGRAAVRAEIIAVVAATRHAVELGLISRARGRHGLGGRGAPTPARGVVPPGPAARWPPRPKRLRRRGGRSRAVRPRSRARGARCGTSRPAWRSARRGGRRPAAPALLRALPVAEALPGEEVSAAERAERHLPAIVGRGPDGAGFRPPPPAAYSRCNAQGPGVPGPEAGRPDAGRTRRERHGGLPSGVSSVWASCCRRPRSTATSASAMRCG